MRRRIALLSGLLLLTACGGNGEALACEREYWDGEVGVCVPNGWLLLDRETLRQRGAPEETLLALQTDIAVSGQFPAITLTSEQVSSGITAEAYSQAGISSVTAIGGYERLETVDASIDGEDVEVHIFTAQPVEDEPRRRFYQVSTVAGSTGYTLTAVTPVSIEEDFEESILFIFDSLTFTEPETEEE